MTTQVAPRQARLYVSRLDPWSVAKVAFVLAIALGVVTVVAVSVLWFVLNALDVFGTLARTANDVIGSATSDFDLEALLSFQRVVGLTAVFVSVQVILTSAAAALVAVMYNLTVGLTGGVEVVLTDDL